MELSMEHRICRRDEIIIKVSRERLRREFLPLQRDCRWNFPWNRCLDNFKEEADLAPRNNVCEVSSRLLEKRMSFNRVFLSCHLMSTIFSYSQNAIIFILLVWNFTSEHNYVNAIARWLILISWFYVAQLLIFIIFNRKTEDKFYIFLN